MDVKKIKFQSHEDDRGNLVAIEEYKDIPYSIKRVYYIFKAKNGGVRGQHAHKTFEETLICVSGQCTIHLDDGKTTEEIILNNPGEGVYVAPGMWREMYDFSEDAVLLVLASELYNEEDYIRNYDEFYKIVSQK